MNKRTYYERNVRLRAGDGIQYYILSYSTILKLNCVCERVRERKKERERERERDS
jgi:hypothetical protein